MCKQNLKDASKEIRSGSWRKIIDLEGTEHNWLVGHMRVLREKYERTPCFYKLFIVLQQQGRGDELPGPLLWARTLGRVVQSKRALKATLVEREPTVLADRRGGWVAVR